jgi:hypothetical protein
MLSGAGLNGDSLCWCARLALARASGNGSRTFGESASPSHVRESFAAYKKRLAGPVHVVHLSTMPISGYASAETRNVSIRMDPLV